MGSYDGWDVFIYWINVGYYKPIEFISWTLLQSLQSVPPNEPSTSVHIPEPRMQWVMCTAPTSIQKNIVVKSILQDAGKGGNSPGIEP